MAKTSSASPSPDLNAVMSFVASRLPEPLLDAAPLASSPEPIAAAPAATAPTPTGPPAASQQPRGSRELPPAGGEQLDYAAAFLQPVRSRKMKAVYVDDHLHLALSTLSQAAGVGLADLLINMANHHFDTFRPAIRQFLNEQERLKKKTLPY